MASPRHSRTPSRPGLFWKILAILPREERWKMAGLLVAMLGSGLLQTSGIASVMPFITLVANPSIVRENAWMHRAYETFGFSSPRQFLTVMGGCVVVLYACSNAFAAITTWFAYQFAWRNHHCVAQRLLDGYLNKPYSFFLGRHGADLGKALLSEVHTVIEGVVVPSLDVVAKSVTVVFVVALLVLADPKLALTIGDTRGYPRG